MTNYHVVKNAFSIVAIYAQLEYRVENLLKEILAAYSESYRYFHTIEHIATIIRNIKAIYSLEVISQEQYHSLLLAALYHDIIYDPKA